jgi:hypothetical protein
MGGMFGASVPSGGGGINSSVGLARIAQANPAIGGILGQMGYTGPSGPQQPVGTGTTPAPAGVQSGLGDIAQYGKNLMAGQPLGTAATGAPGTNAAGKPAATPSLLPAAWQPQVAPVQMPINPYAQQTSPGSVSPMAAGGRNPQFFPFFRG